VYWIFAGRRFVIVDLGRYWNVWKIPLIWNWNRNSVLLEVAICIMTYVVVLWIELSRRSSRSGRSRRSTLCSAGGRRSTDGSTGTVAILASDPPPTMHQSSSAPSCHHDEQAPQALHTRSSLPLPGDAVLMGYAASSSNRRWRTRCSTGRGRRRSWRLAGIMVGILFFFLGVRSSTRPAGPVGFVPAGLLQLDVPPGDALFLGRPSCFFPEAKVQPGFELISAILIMLGGSLYRFDTSWSASNPSGWSISRRS